MKLLVPFILLALVSYSCGGPVHNGEDSHQLLIRNVSLIDGNGNEPVIDMDLLIEGNRIKQISKSIEKPSGADEIDGIGMTVLPGLIDSHVHISSVPGSGYRKDSSAVIEKLQRHHLKAYLACGVTTILDPAIKVQEAKKIKKWLSDGQAGPRLYLLSPAFTAKEGYLATEVLGLDLTFPPVSNVQDIEDRLNESGDLDARGIKVFVESGFGFGKMPSLSNDLLQIIKKKSAERNLPLYIHATDSKDILRAIDLEPHALVHGAEAGSDEALAKLKQHPIYLITTMSVHDSWKIEKDRSRLSDPYYTATVPEIELRTADTQAAWDLLSSKFAKLVGIDGPTDDIASDSIAGDAVDPLEIWFQNVKKQYEAGLPVVMGSDSGNWPVFPQIFHGPTSVREIELLVLAGLPPIKAIQASTSIPAEMLGLSEDIGTIEEGKIADLIIVKGDPQKNIRALRNIQWTILDGIAKKPEQWME
jgi:imidazolonepropionase-like amidohydrolase